MKFHHNYTKFNSIKKHLLTIFFLSRTPHQLFVSGKEIITPTVKNIRISDNFYRSIKCEHCGQCCRRYWCIWDGSEPSIPILEFSRMQQETFSIHYNTNYLLFVSSPDEKYYHCRFTEQNQGKYWCRIYQNRPLLSRMPHIFFKVKNETLIVTKRQFGRNHKLKCQSKIKEFDYDEFINSDLPTLEYLKKCILYYQKPEQSFIDEVIEKVEEGASERRKTT